MKTTLLLLILLAGIPSVGQDTFSICAFDPQTGEVGSAGATCIESSAISCIIISDVHPGVGVVHTQSYWLASNQNYGNDLMQMDLTAQQVIDSLVANDVQNNPGIRQYGVVRIDNGGSCASFTGEDCMDYKNHIVGPNYAIQGNILLGQQILDSMETRFNNTEGTLACKLMAAMQGAKVVGADTRCEDFGTSSFSAFVRVAGPFDDPDALSFDLSVNTYAELTEPIDSLQVLFDELNGCAFTSVESAETFELLLEQSQGQVRLIATRPVQQVILFDTSGKQIKEINSDENLMLIDTTSLNRGIYVLRITAGDQVLTRSFSLVN